MSGCACPLPTASKPSNARSSTSARGSTTRIPDRRSKTRLMKGGSRCGMPCRLRASSGTPSTAVRSGNPSGIPAATVFDRGALVSSSFPSPAAGRGPHRSGGRSLRARHTSEIGPRTKNKQWDGDRSLTNRSPFLTRWNLRFSSEVRSDSAIYPWESARRKVDNCQTSQ